MSDGRPRLMYLCTTDHIVRGLLPHLDAARNAGFAVEVACRLTRFGSELKAHADAVHPMPFRRFPLHPDNLRGLFQAIRLLRARPSLIVHTHQPTGGFVGRLAATLVRVPARIYTVHGFHFHQEGGALTNVAYRVIETFAGHLLSDAVMVINRDDRTSAIDDGIVPADRVFLVGNGIDTVRFSPEGMDRSRRAQTRERLDVPPCAPVLTMVAEMIPRKRHSDALTALTAIRDRFSDVQLLLVGDGKLEAALRRDVEARGLSGNVRFLGFQADVAPILAITDVFLFPSRQEGLPWCIQEAMAMGVPVVATNIRGNRDLVTPECGRLVPFGDTDALADAVVELLSLPATDRAAMGACGRRRMTEERDFSCCCREWLDVYEVVLRRKGRAMPDADAVAASEPSAVRTLEAECVS